MFTADEADAIAIGVRLLRRLRDPKLQSAAESVLAKLAAVVPVPLQPHLVAAPVFVSEGSAPPVSGVDLGELRSAIHETRKISIDYADEGGRQKRRTLVPRHTSKTRRAMCTKKAIDYSAAPSEAEAGRGLERGGWNKF
jgi:predicted DNA-binding transcriptional regulator YafY